MSDLSARQDDRWFTARGIAIKAGAIRTCEYHGDCLMVGDREKDRDAYRIANSRFNKGELGDLFDSREQLNETIKAAIDEIALDYCPRCDKLRED